jgi:GT2 family glycosyltransferase
MIHVIVAVYNRLQLTINCISFLRQQQNFEDLNIIVVDDGSTDGTSEYLKKECPDIKILNGTGSLFSAGCFHLGIEYVKKISNPGDWVLLVSNDSEISSNTILELVNVSNSKNRMALTGALAVNLDDKKTIIRSGTVVESWFLNKTKHIYENLKLDQITNKNPVEVDFLPGRCILHPIEMFIAVGNYDAKRFKHYGNDEEFSVRAKKFGYPSLLCPSSIIYVKSNEEIVTPKISIKYFFHTFFSMKSSVNIIDKFKLTIKIVPLYAKISFFIIGVLKSLYFFFKR